MEDKQEHTTKIVGAFGFAIAAVLVTVGLVVGSEALAVIAAFVAGASCGHLWTSRQLRGLGTSQAVDARITTLESDLFEATEEIHRLRAVAEFDSELDASRDRDA